MYSPIITARDVSAVELALGRPLDSYTPDESRAISAAIDALILPSGGLTRPLSDDEQRFIHDERLRCQLDLRYFLRYVQVQLDTALGGFGPMKLWDSQLILLDHMAWCEESMWADYERQLADGISVEMIRVNGICLVVLKGRQLGGTVIVTAALIHRFLFWPHGRLVVASEDQPKTEELFREKTLLIYDNLPRWMRPNLTLRAGDTGMRSEELDTTIFLQHAKQEGGIAMGGTTHGGHFTEMGNWEKSVAQQFQNNVMGSIPFSLLTLVVCESRAQGQGNYWHHLCMSALAGGSRAGRWHGVFIPWYAEPTKYRLLPPEGWRPKSETLKIAYQVYSTSERWCGTYTGGRWVGRRVELDPSQLYWYEKTHAAAETNPGGLAALYGDYPIVPEEAFQSTVAAPFSPKVLERLALGCRDPWRSYEWLDRGARPADLSINPDDPRGVIRLYERPDRAARYVMAVDTAPGIPGWTRRMPLADDHKKDNCAIEVVRVGERGAPDVQVAEFIAPIDYVAAAPIINWLGRRFRGREGGMCELIVETGPTSGEALQERLLGEFDYWNLYRKLNQATYNYSTSFGWAPTQQSVFDLWFRTKPHISFAKRVRAPECRHADAEDCEHVNLRVKFEARSRYLVDVEMRNCEEDPKRQIAKAEFGYHDDAIRATQMALYAAHKWESYGEVADAAIEQVPDERKPDFQARDVSHAEMVEIINERLEPESAGGVW